MLFIFVIKKYVFSRSKYPTNCVFKFENKSTADITRTVAVVYEGMYGPWSVDDTDIAEVYGYRIGISVSAVGLLMGAVSMVAGIPTPKELLNAECVAAAAGLGVSLFLIHIYVTEIKRVIQVQRSASVF